MRYTVKIDPIDIKKPIFFMDFETLEQVNEYCSQLAAKKVYFRVIDKLEVK